VQRRGKEAYVTVSVGRTWQVRARDRRTAGRGWHSLPAHPPPSAFGRPLSKPRQLQIFNTAKLTLVMVGPQLSRAVTALAVKGDLTFAATGANIEECRRAHK
jgi:hypothetical protein